jgi:PD-(D/E)XK nuclease superfamily
MIVEGDANIKQEIEVLLSGGTLRKSISEDVVFGNIQETPDALWNFFLFSGYLKVKNKVFNDEVQEGDFLIPNIEIRTIFKDSILYWFSKSQTYNSFNVVLENLKKGRLEDFEDYFEDFILKVCSYYDFVDQEPERVYHALVLGMMVQLQTDYRITSNRESGFGRYDIILHPLKNELPAYIFEFKKFNAKRETSIEQSLHSAMQQMKTKNYAAILHQEGHQNIHLIAIAFKGKVVRIKCEEV